MRIDDRLGKENATINGVGSCLIPGAEAGQGDYRNERFYSIKRITHRTPLTTTLSIDEDAASPLPNDKL